MINVIFPGSLQTSHALYFLTLARHLVRSHATRGNENEQGGEK